MKKVEIIIGANYGDEGKGLLTRHFSLNAIHNNEKAIVVFSQGTAQRGHTVDYNPKFRHIYHHFGSGTGDGLPTYFADTFWIHPMEFAREYAELAQAGIHPVVYCHPDAPVITPFDMLVDHVNNVVSASMVLVVLVVGAPLKVKGASKHIQFLILLLMIFKCFIILWKILGINVQQF